MLFAGSPADGPSEPTMHANGTNGVNGVNSAYEPPMRTSTRLRQLLAGPGLVVAPGVFDGVSAHLAVATSPQAICAPTRPQHR